REKDPRKVRERATQEGVLAEHALRKLMAARNAKAATNGSFAQDRQGTKRRLDEEIWKETVSGVEREDEESRARSVDRDIDFGSDGATARVSASVPNDLGHSMIVNYDRIHWRGGSS
ncbi:hypothetical protein LTR16_002365, partial [Cryomyces antarcticus]